jgi:hypothetical protein
MYIHSHSQFLGEFTNLGCRDHLPVGGGTIANYSSTQVNPYMNEKCDSKTLQNFSSD